MDIFHPPLLWVLFSFVFALGITFFPLGRAWFSIKYKAAAILETKSWLNTDSFFIFSPHLWRARTTFVSADLSGQSCQLRQQENLKRGTWIAPSSQNNFVITIRWRRKKRKDPEVWSARPPSGMATPGVPHPLHTQGCSRSPIYADSHPLGCGGKAQHTGVTRGARRRRSHCPTAAQMLNRLEKRMSSKEKSQATHSIAAPWASKARSKRSVQADPSDRQERRPKLQLIFVFSQNLNHSWNFHFEIEVLELKTRQKMDETQRWGKLQELVTGF